MIQKHDSITVAVHKLASWLWHPDAPLQTSSSLDNVSALYAPVQNMLLVPNLGWRPSLFNSSCAAIRVSNLHFSTCAAEDEMWVTHQACVMIDTTKRVCVCVWPYLLEKSINDLQKHAFASLCSYFENCCPLPSQKPSEVTSSSLFLISVSIEKRSNAQRLKLMEGPPGGKVQTLS